MMKTEIAKADKRSLRSRKWLLNALLELIHEKPFAEITVSEITDRADVSRQTFYIHYYNKRDLLNELVDREFLQFRDTLLARIKSDHLDGTNISELMFRFWLENKASLRGLLAADADQRLSKKLGELTSEIVEINVRYHQRDKGVKADYISDFISAGIFALLQRWINSSDDIDPSELAQIAGDAADAIGRLARDE